MVLKHNTIRGKLFCDDPQALQKIADRLLNEFTPRISVSRPLPADKGDYHIIVTIYPEGGRR